MLKARFLSELRESEAQTGVAPLIALEPASMPSPVNASAHKHEGERAYFSLLSIFKPWPNQQLHESILACAYFFFFPPLAEYKAEYMGNYVSERIMSFLPRCCLSVLT